MKDRIIDELPESALPPAVTLTTATPDYAPTPPLGANRLSPKRGPIPLFPAPDFNEPTFTSQPSLPSSNPLEIAQSTSGLPTYPPPPPSLLQKEQPSSSKQRDPSSRPVLSGPLPTAPARPNLIRLPTQPVFNHSSSDPTSTAPKRIPTDASTAAGSPSTSLVETSSTSSVRALVVDDDPLTRRLMERMLNVRF